MIELIGKELFQWNKGRQLKINADANKAVFSTDNVQGISRDIVDNIVTIPDSLLKEGKPILVYITIEDEEQRQVIRRKMFNVIPAPKPEDYEETEEAFTEKLENLLDLMYNGNVDEILVFTNEGPQWVNKNEVFEAGTMEETDPTVPEWAKQPKNSVTFIENTTDTPLYFSEMESGVYVLRGTFRNIDFGADFHDRETEFVFDTDTLVRLFVNENTLENGEVKLDAFIISAKNGAIQHAIVRDTDLTYGYNAKTSKLATYDIIKNENLLRFGYKDDNKVPWENIYPAILFDGEVPLINNGQNYYYLLTADNSYTKKEVKEYVDNAIKMALSNIGIAEDGEF